MTAIRRHMVRRIQRDTGKGLLEILRGCRGLTVLQMASRYVQPANSSPAEAQ